MVLTLKFVGKPVWDALKFDVLSIVCSHTS